MGGDRQHKIIRSYRVVFHRRWRIFRVQGWRIPLPGGLELRAVGNWLAALAAIALLGSLPLLGAALSQLHEGVRYLALPAAAAWALSRWEVDGRSPHRALAGLAGWWLRPRCLAAMRRCPRPGAELSPIEEVAATPDLGAPSYPRGTVVGPARLLLRYPAQVCVGSAGRFGLWPTGSRLASARPWCVSQAGEVPLHRGRVVEVPTGRRISFEAKQ